MTEARRPPEPNRDADPLITNAADLVANLGAVPPGGSVSLRISGVLRFGGMPVMRFGGMPVIAETLLPFIRGLVTLWSDDGAVLDAEGAGRLFFVRRPPARRTALLPLRPATHAPLPDLPTRSPSLRPRWRPCLANAPRAGGRSRPAPAPR